jgi:hypothetical protein
MRYIWNISGEANDFTLENKNVQCIFTGKSDRAVVHPELQPHKQ